MVHPGQSAPLGGSQQVPSSLLRSNSGLLGGQGGSMPSQPGFPSLTSPRNQFNNMSILGNMQNVSSLLNQSFGNGIQTSALSGPGSSQRGMIDGGAESDPLYGIGNGMSFASPSSSYLPSNMVNNSNASGQVSGKQFANSPSNQMLPDQQQAQQLKSQNFQHNQQSLQQLSLPNNNHHHQHQQYQSVRGGLSGVGQVKMEPQTTNDQQGQTPQQLLALRNMGSVKLESQQMQTMRNLPSVKLEPQHSDQSSYIHQQQQQQQQLLQMSRQSPQAAAAQINLLHQQRVMQLQQQQQNLMKANPQQRSLQMQLQQQNLPLRSPVKSVYEPGMCARRLTHYMYQQQHRPEDNNIEFWRKFVAEYFAPNAKKKWCVSMYGSGRQTTGVFPQDVWHCAICNRKPGRGFEATAEVLPRLFKIKYESGTLEELLYVDMPKEYQNPSGQIVLDYAKAIQESVFEQLRVVRDGQLRIVFTADLKICSWEFCARRHEELIPRRLLIPQVSQLGVAAQKYQASTQNASSSLSVQDLQTNCNMFAASARQLAKALEVPLVNDLGYTKRYVRCLQISEVVNSMKDLIDYSRETGTGPMESLAKFPRRASASGFNSQQQAPEEQQRQQQQQPMAQNLSNNESSVHAQLVNGVPTNSLNSASAMSTASTIVGLLHQNSMNSRLQNPVNNANSPYGGNGVQIQSPSLSTTMPQSQANSSFQSPTPSTSNNPPQTSAAHLSSTNSPNVSMQQPALSGDADQCDSQSSVQKIIQEMMMSSQLGGGGMGGVSSMGNEIKTANGLMQSSSNSGLMGNGTINNNTVFGSMNGLGQSATSNGIRAVISNSMSMNGRQTMTMTRDQMMHNQQEDMGSQLLNGLGAVNGFSNLQFDWKASP